MAERGTHGGGEGGAGGDAGHGHGRGREPHDVPAAQYSAETVTALDIPRRPESAPPPNTPNVRPELDSSVAPAPVGNPLASAIREMSPAELLNVAHLRREAERTHVHDHKGGMTGSA